MYVNHVSIGRASIFKRLSYPHLIYDYGTAGSRAPDGEFLLTLHRISHVGIQPAQTSNISYFVHDARSFMTCTVTQEAHYLIEFLTSVQFCL